MLSFTHHFNIKLEIVGKATQIVDQHLNKQQPMLDTYYPMQKNPPLPGDFYFYRLARGQGSSQQKSS